MEDETEEVLVVPVEVVDAGVVVEEVERSEDVPEEAEVSEGVEVEAVVVVCTVVDVCWVVVDVVVGVLTEVVDDVERVPC